MVKLKVYGFASVRPLTAAAVASTVTSYRVAYGSGVFASGVKMRIVVPDQRNAPGMAGVMVT